MDMASQPNPEQRAPAQAVEKSIRLIRPSVVVLCGPAACGKSTFAERHFRTTQIISSDWARGRVCDDERDQRFQTQAFALVHFLMEQRLSLNRLCVVDSTALTSQARRELLDLARKYQVPCIALVFDIPLEKCLERDQARERTVGRPVIERQYQAFEQARLSIRAEGFDQVIELRDEDLNRARIEIVFRPLAHPVARPARPAPAPERRGPRTGPPGPAAAPSAETPGRTVVPQRAAGPSSGLPGARTSVPNARQPALSVPAVPSKPAPVANPKPPTSAPAQPPSAPGPSTAGGSDSPQGAPAGGPSEPGKT